MNKIEVRHLRHREDYSLTMETQDRMIELVAGKHDTRVVFYEVSPNEMLDLANQIIQIAFKIKDREGQDATASDACKDCAYYYPQETRDEALARRVLGACKECQWGEYAARTH